MALEVSEVLRQRWKSRKHVGAAKPAIYVEIRKGNFVRGYGPWPGEKVHATIPGHTGEPWQATWTPTTDWVEIPNVLTAEIGQSFDNNGLMTCTIDVENVVLEATTGVGGLFHKVRRGFFSPFRGRGTKHRSQIIDPLTGERVEPNDWTDVLNSNAQINVWEGYGEDQLVRTFTGLIDDTDLTSKPDKATITLRCFGQVLTDQRMFGWAKEKSIRDPICFADRRSADDVKKIASGAKASSSAPGHPARFVLPTKSKGSKTAWISDAHTTDDATEWVEVRLTEGRYEDFHLFPYYEGSEVYVSIFGKPLKNGDPPTVDGEAKAANDWIHVGLGDVPGAHGGVPYVFHADSIPARSRDYRLGKTFVVGDGSILRIHFRDLRRSTFRPEDSPGNAIFRAGVREMYGIKRRRRDDVKKAKWILVDDLADVVRIILRWGGFKEWDVEDTGISLSDPMICNRQTYLIEPIKKIAELTGFIFFMAEPTDDDLSIGIPTFRRSNLLGDQGAPDYVELIQDRDLLTGIKARWTDEPLAYIIRFRGKEAKKKEGGITLGGGEQPGTYSDRRLMYEYRPPWSRDRKALAGIIKHVVYVEPQLRSVYECHLACILAALQQILAAQTAVVEFPAFPSIQLDDRMAVIDTGTGLNTALYVANKSHTFTAGKTTTWVQTVNGSIIDTADTDAVFQDYVDLLNDHQEEEAAAARAATRRRLKPKQKRKKGGK